MPAGAIGARGDVEAAQALLGRVRSRLAALGELGFALDAPRADGWLPGLDLSLSVRNLFDKRYAHPGADTNWQNTFEQDGRSVRVVGRWRF